MKGCSIGFSVTPRVWAAECGKRGKQEVPGKKINKTVSSVPNFAAVVVIDTYSIITAAAAAARLIILFRYNRPNFVPKYIVGSYHSPAIL